jgi:hypothetical protein
MTWVECDRSLERGFQLCYALADLFRMMGRAKKVGAGVGQRTTERTH